MIPYKDGLSTLRENGPKQFSLDVTRWAINNIESKFVDHLDSILISRDELRKSADEVHYFSESEEITISPWEEVYDLSNYKKIHRTPDKKYKIGQPFIANVNNGKVLEYNGMCATQDYNILLDSGKSRNPLGKRVSPIKVMKNKIQYSKNSHDAFDYQNAVPFTSIIRSYNNSGFTNYYVWVHNYLPKLQGVKYWSSLTNEEFSIIIPKNSPSWVIESLEMFGLSNNLSFWNPTDELLIKNLLVPSNRRVEGYPNSSQFKFLSPNACTWIREEAKNQINSYENNFPNKIFISRRDAGRRELENREDLVAKLKNRGFVSYELSNLTFKEQVELFSQADHILGVHGAGLVNMMFSSDCTVTEIFGDKLMPTYFLLAKSCDLKYQSISGQSSGNLDLPLHNQDVRVNPELVINKLEENK